MTEESILQISNDISEDMLSPKVTKAQLVEVVKYFREKCEENWSRYQQLLGKTYLNELKSLIDESAP